MKAPYNSFSYANYQFTRVQPHLQRLTTTWPDQQSYKKPIVEHVQLLPLVFILLLKQWRWAIHVLVNHIFCLIQRWKFPASTGANVHLENADTNETRAEDIWWQARRLRLRLRTLNGDGAYRIMLEFRCHARLETTLQFGMANWDGSIPMSSY